VSQYYYLVSSLPYLYFDGNAPLEEGKFLGMAAARLSSRHMAILRATTLAAKPEQVPPTPVHREWQHIDAGLRNELARLRAGALDMDPQSYVKRDRDGRDWSELWQVAETALSAFNQDSPLRAEELLSAFRWSVLEQLEVGHFFDIERICLYYLKLQLLWRKDRFDREEGLKIFQDTYETILNDFYNAED